MAAEGLLEGGVDLFILETHFDLLAVKASVIGVRRAMAKVGRQVPIQAQVTMELTGRMLVGTEIGAALAAIDPLKVDIVGLNCATGPTEMGEHIRHLCQHSRRARSPCCPTPACPSVVDGKMHYDLTRRADGDPPAPLRRGARRPGHRRLLRHHARVHQAARRHGAQPHAAPPAPSTTSRRSRRSTPPCRSSRTCRSLMIGERTNANGSKKFREAMLDGDYDTCTAMATEQIKSGAHVLDVCVDYVGRDGTGDMDEIASRFATQANAPLVLDSTEPEVIEAGLQWIGGRAILNSANLEDGFAEGSRLDRVFTLAKEYGAAVICLCIDEEGQARDAEWKVRVAKRIAELARDTYGLENHDLIFDALTFPLSTGDDDLRRDAMETMDAIKAHQGGDPGLLHHARPLQRELRPLPRLAPRAQQRVHARVRSRSASTRAIVHASKIMPLSKIPDEQRDVAMDLIYDRRGAAGALSEGAEDYDPLPEVPRRLRRREGGRGGEGGPVRLAGRQAPPPPHHRRRPREPHRRPRPGHGRGHHPARHHQRAPARRHEGRRRAVRLRRDAAAVRAPERRDHEGLGRLPRAVHGEGGRRRRRLQGPHRARHRQGRRPRHRQEPRRHHPHQQRLRGPQHRDQDLDLAR